MLTSEVGVADDFHVALAVRDMRLMRRPGTENEETCEPRP